MRMLRRFAGGSSRSDRDTLPTSSLVRPIQSYPQLRDADRLRERVVVLRGEGHTGERIAEVLNRESFSTRQHGAFDKERSGTSCRPTGWPGSGMCRTRVRTNGSSGPGEGAGGMPREAARVDQQGVETWTPNAESDRLDRCPGTRTHPEPARDLEAGREQISGLPARAAHPQNAGIGTIDP
jgi:hypothetical protein